jgi:hypothetical protein
MVDYVELPKSHPYWKHSGISIFETSKGWRLKYRDFTTMMQDTTFDTRELAEAAYKRISERHLKGIAFCGYAEADLKECDRHWQELKS